MENNQQNGEKMPSPPSQMPQQQPSVPSIFLAPTNANNPPPQQIENNTSTNQTTQTSVWNSGSGIEMQRVRSPTNTTSSTTSITGGGGSIMDLYKMKSCASTQCGSYDGLGGNMQMGGGGGCHPQPMQSRLYPPSYIQQQQQQQMTNMTMPIRSMHQHHHHHGISAQCHPHYAQQSMTGSAPHLADRMIHSVTTTTSATGNGGPYISDHNHHHHHHGHTGGISAAAAAAAQYAHQQQQHQRMVNSAAAASLNPYRQLPIPTHHQQKVINASQAAAAYQTAYQHQYNQYHGMVHSHSAAAAAASSSSLNPYYRQLPTTHQQLTSSQAYQSAYQHHHHSAYQYHHGGIISHSHSHPHHQTNGGPSAAGGVAGVVQQRMLGIPIASAQQHQQQQQTHRMVPYISRTCQPHLLTSSNYQQAGAQQHQHQQQQQLVNHLEASSSTGAGAVGGVSNTTMSTTQITNTDLNNNSNSGKSAASSSTAITGTKSLNKKASTEQLIVCSQKGLHGSSLKIKLSSTNTASPEKSVKIKATRSVTKLRDRQQRLAIGQKKKSVGSGINGSSGSSSSRKLKSLKALNAALERDCSGSGKRLTSTLVEGIEGNGDAKRSRKAGKSGGGGEGAISVVTSGSGGVSVQEEVTEESSKKGGNGGGVEETSPSVIGGDLNRSVTDNYFLEEQNGDEYVPTPEEMRKYLERLNTCNNLKIPLYYAYSVFHGKLALLKKDNNCSSEDSGNSAPTTTTTAVTEGTITTTTTTIYYHQLHPQEFNFTSYYNNDWDTNAAAESEWQQFQDDMAVLEAYFPLLSTMEQSERAEKLDTIYSYEGQMKLINSTANTPVTSGTCPVVGVVGGVDQISPPCNCVTVQDVQAQECSCCYNYLALSHHPMASSPEELAEQIACRNSSFVGGDSPQQFVMEGGYPPQPHYMSTPLSSRRQYAGGSHFYDEENGYYFRDVVAGGGGAAVAGVGTMKARIGARKRSSSFPSRKSGRRNSGSRDHLKSETESFLDELISTANEEKLSKNKNNSGEVTGPPEIQCEVDFPSLASSAAVPYNKRQAKKSKPEETLSARDEYLASSSTNSSSGAGTEESESNGSACSSSSPQSTHNTSSDGDYEGTTEITLLDNNGHIAATTTIASPSKRNHRSIMVSSSSCGHFPLDEPSGGRAVCCPNGTTNGGAHHLWDEFRGDEIIALPAESYQTTCIPVSSISHLISHCTCRRGDAICPTRPPPGFEHLSRPAFPIELYDPTLLGNLIGAQLPREVLASLDASSIPKKQFEEMEELLLSLTCCEKHAVDKMLHSRKLSSASSSLQTQEIEAETPAAQQEPSAEGEEKETKCEGGDKTVTDTEDEWELLDRAIKLVLQEWTEELGFRRRMQDILYSLNLQELFGGCCKRTDLLDQTHQTSSAAEQMENVHYIFGSSSSLSKSFASDESSSMLLRSGTADP